MPRGTFIAIEGIDGAGKRTQFQLLRAALAQRGLSLFCISFPRYDSFFGRLVARYLNGEFGSLAEVDPHFSALLYAGDRLEAKGELEAALAEGRVVLADRYIGSNLAHQGARVPASHREEFLSWLRQLEFAIYALPSEDLVLYLRLPAEQVADRVADRAAEREAAADACQEAFLKAYQALNQYRGGSFKSWLMRIVTNTCYDQLRYRSRRPANSLENMTENPGQESIKLVNGSERPEEQVLRAELNHLLQFGISHLPEDQRLVLVLSDVQGFSYQEIAEIIEQPLGTVKSRLSRARRQVPVEVEHVE